MIVCYFKSLIPYSQILDNVENDGSNTFVILQRDEFADERQIEFIFCRQMLMKKMTEKIGELHLT